MNKLSPAIALLALILSGVCLFLILGKQQKIAYVELEQIYNDFQMKKELEARFQNVTQMRQGILDSLKLELNALSKRITSEKDEENIRAFQAMRQEYIIKEENFMQSNQQTTQQYKDQIWKQLSEYVQEYGKNHHYEYILGYEKNSAGVLYGNPVVDVTEEVKQFVNQAYSGKSTAK